MQTIPEELVERTWKKMSDLPFEKMPKLIDAMQKEQPIIVAFLMGASHDDLNQAERELQFYLGTVVWQIMRQNKPPKRVNEKRMDELIERTEKMAEFLMGESDVDFVNSSINIFENHNQRHVMRYVVEALFEDEEELEEDLEEEGESESEEVERPDFMDKLYQISRYERAKAHPETEASVEEEDDDNDDEVRGRMKGIIFLNLKTVVEALDQ